MHERLLRTALVGLLASMATAVPTHSAEQLQPSDPFETLLKLESTYDSVRSFTTRLHKWERIDGELVFQVIDVRFRQPGDVYFEVIEGRDQGVVAIYRPGQEGNEFTVRLPNPVTDFFAQLIGKRSIDPFGTDAMKSQHHPVTEMSLSNMAATIIRDIREARERDEDSIRFGETEILDGHETHRISMTSPPLDGDSYIAKEGDTLWTIARDFDQDMSVILHHNPLIAGRPGAIREGQEVFVPHYYAYQTDVWVDTSTNLISQIKVYDWNRELYEHYRYENLRINIQLAEEQFRFD